jgi:hypothetical protein
MKNTQIKKENPAIWDTILLFLMIYISADTLMFGTNGDNKYIYFSYIFMILITIFLFLRLKNKLILPKKNFSFFFLMSFLLLVSMAVNSDYRFGYAIKILLLFQAMLFVMKYSFDDFCYMFDRVMTLVALLSIIGYIYMMLTGGELPTNLITVNTNGRTFYNIGFCISPNYTDQIRNWAFFREPGVYQIYLILALLIQVCILVKKDIRKIIIYIIAIITTASTTGYIALAGVIALIVIKQGGISKKKKGMLLLFIATTISYLVIYTDLLSLDASKQYVSVFGKFFNLERGTTVSRLASITVNIRMFLMNPVTGIGLGGIENNFIPLVQKYYFVAAAANTNMLLIQYSAHGLFYGLLWTWAFFRFGKRFASRPIELLFVFFVLFAFLSGENIHYGVLPGLLLMYGVNSNATRNSELSEK